MLWQQAWVETRSRFLIGVAVLVIVAIGTVYDYLAVLKLAPLAASIDTSALGDRVRQSIELQRTFRGYIWVQGFSQTIAHVGTLLAVLLGCGTVLSRSSAPFTLSLPVTRSRVLGARIATGLLEWLVVAIAAAMTVSIVAPAVGQHYAPGDALLHGVSLFVAGAVFYSAATLLSTLLTDIWQPLLLTCVVAVVVGTAESFVPAGVFGIFRVMSAQTYFFTGAVSWAGLLTCVVLCGALLYAARAALERREF